MNIDSIWRDILTIREKSPLIHNITNYVVMNNTANALLALGASPVMAHAINEVEEMTNISSALVINIGTLSNHWVEAMSLAMATAKQGYIPIILDPVGVGATSYRTNTVLQLIGKVSPTVITGNASEIMALLDSSITTKGVDSSKSSLDSLESAKVLAKKYNCIVVVSGIYDTITDGDDVSYADHGHEMMAKVTGLGCTSTALIGAFCAVNNNFMDACTNAMTLLGICGEIAAEVSKGPASLQLNIIDCLYSITKKELSSHIIHS